MSKIMPYKETHDPDHDEAGDEHVCPRYEKYLKRLGNDGDGLNVQQQTHRPKVKEPKSKFCKRNSIRRNRRSSIPMSNKRDTDSIGSGSSRMNGKRSNRRHKVPLRSRSVFVKIRQKGRNFGIRCKTSVELWRKWIKRGIGWGDQPLTTPLTTSTKIINNNNVVTKKANVVVLSKKNIINEVIPEEEEPDENSKAVEDRTITTRGTTLNQQVNNNQHANKIETKKQCEKTNEITNGKKIKNIFKKTSIISMKTNQETSNKDQSINDDHHHDVQVNGVNNDCVSKKKRSLIDVIDEIEHLTVNNDKGKDESSVPGQHMEFSSKTNKNAIRRAFMKLRLFF